MRLILSTVHRVEEIAKRRGATMAQVALAWILSRPGTDLPQNPNRKKS